MSNDKRIFSMAKNGMVSKGVSIRPLGDRVVVKPAAKEEKSASGIIIPDTVDKEKPAKGVVIAVGPGRYNDEGKRIPMDVKVGDKVFFKKPWDEPIKVDDIEYYVLSESEITLILK
jgi:chaperonin GroES